MKARAGTETQAQSSALPRLRPINQLPLNKAVIDALIEMIEAAGLGVGDRLPPEADLAKQLGVGRSTIREALKAWQSMGIVVRNKGAGTLLAAEVSSTSVHVPITLKLEAESLLRTNGVRRPLEVEASRLAAMRASDDDRERIVHRVQALLDDYHAGRDWRAADARFHAAIHDASGNPLFSQLISQIHSVFHSIYHDPLGLPLLGADSIPLHGDLARAIVAGDADEAAATMFEISNLVDIAVRERLAHD